MSTLRYGRRLPPVPTAVSQRPRLHPTEQLPLALSCSRGQGPRRIQTPSRRHRASTAWLGPCATPPMTNSRGPACRLEQEQRAVGMAGSTAQRRRARLKPSAEPSGHGWFPVGDSSWEAQAEGRQLLCSLNPACGQKTSPRTDCQDLAASCPFLTLRVHTPVSTCHSPRGLAGTQFSQGLRTPSLAPQIRKGSSQAPSPEPRDGRWCSRWRPLLPALGSPSQPRRLTKSPHSHNVAPKGTDHKVGPLIPHAQAAGQLGPGACRRGEGRGGQGGPMGPPRWEDTQDRPAHRAPGRTSPRC